MAAANQRARDDLGIEELIDLEGMTRTYSNLEHCDLSQDLVIAERERPDDRLHPGRSGRTSRTAAVQFFSFGILDPAERRQGIGQSMLSWSEGRLARDRGRSAGRSARRAPCATCATPTSGHASCSSGTAGDRSPAGTTWSGPRSTTSRRSRCPTGLIVRPIDRGRSAHRLGGRTRSVPGPPGRGGVDRGRLGDVPGRLPDMSTWVIAFDGDEVAGGIWNRIDQQGERLPRPATRRPPDRLDGCALAAPRPGQGADRAQPRGRCATRGMTSAALDVDGANPNQAMSLYLGQGFEITDQCDGLAQAAVARSPSDRTDQEST